MPKFKSTKKRSAQKKKVCKPYETTKYIKKSKKLMVCVGHGQWKNHKTIINKLVKDVSAKHHTQSLYLPKNHQKAFIKWANANTLKYVRTHTGKTKSGKKLKYNMLTPNEISKMLLKDFNYDEQYQVSKKKKSKRKKKYIYNDNHVSDLALM